MGDWITLREAEEVRNRLNHAINIARESTADMIRVRIEEPYVDLNLTWEETDNE